MCKGCEARRKAIADAIKAGTMKEAKKAASFVYQSGRDDLKRLLNLKRNGVIK